MEIRRARPEDYEEAGRVTALAYREFGPSTSADPRLRHRNEGGWEDYFARLANVAERAEMAIVFVAAEDGRILGSVTLELRQRIGTDNNPLGPDQAHIRMLGVDPGARRIGVAKALMQRCIEESREAGKTLLTLNTTPMMQAAQTMYESLGFVRGLDEVQPDGFVLLFYSLTLSPTTAGTTSPDTSSTPSSHSA
jgi:ribosomal protein S18 acetylase RimI-like enzyme